MPSVHFISSPLFVLAGFIIFGLGQGRAASKHGCEAFQNKILCSKLRSCIADVISCLLKMVVHLFIDCVRATLLLKGLRDLGLSPLGTSFISRS